MIREEIHAKVNAEGNISKANVIDFMWEHFQSRTCENCVYYFMHMADADRMQCKNHHSLLHQQTVTKDFGCNKFERKEQ